MNSKIIALVSLLLIAGSTFHSAFCQEAEETLPEETTEIEDVDETTLLLPEEGEETSLEEEGELTNFTLWDFVRMLLILGGVIILIYALFFLLKKVSGRNLPNNELFTVISSQQLGNNKSLHLVEVGKQLFLVGAADNAVSLISEINDKESLDEIRFRLADRGVSPRSGNFKDMVSNLFRASPSEGKGADMNNSIDFIHKQRERLKKL